jgi:hypothetical protein
MFLFYSQHCPHCKMLLETIKRHDQRGVIKTICLESLTVAGKPVPPQITAVPALMLMPAREFLFGKHVFDYLLLPGRGKLFTPPAADAAAAPANVEVGEPAPFAFGGGASDAFTAIDGMGSGVAEGGGGGFGDRTYSWSTLDMPSADVPKDMPLQEDTRSRKDDINIDAVRMQRDLDLSSFFGDAPPRLMRP